MVRQVLNGGEIVTIPLANGRVIFGRILYASLVFKDLILLGIYDLVLSAPVMPRELPSLFAFDPVYTSSIGLRKAGWSVVGTHELSEEERNLSLRITGGDVWLQDQRLRSATESDYQQLRQMLVFGYPYLKKKIEAAIPAARP